MPSIDPRTLFNTDILEPDGFGAILVKLLIMDEGSLVATAKFNLTQKSPPILLYQENRQPDNWVDCFVFYGGNGSSGMVQHSGSREILNLPSRWISANERGQILNAFCQIEFCLDAFVCIGEGVFSSGTNYDAIAKEFSKDGRFSTANKKIQYLRTNRLISARSNDFLRKAQQIRNVLSHQFLPQDGVGVEVKDIQRYKSISKAIEIIFNTAWIELMVDYNRNQLAVVRWLEDTMVDAE